MMEADAPDLSAFTRRSILGATVLSAAAPVLAQLSPKQRGESSISSGGRVSLRTDTLQLVIDQQGAAVEQANLLPSGDRVLEVSPDRVFVAQSGFVGAPSLPNHRGPFAFVPGSTSLGNEPFLRATFVGRGGGARATVTYLLRRGARAIEVEFELHNESASPLSPSLYLQLIRDGNDAGPRGGPIYIQPGEPVRRVRFNDIEAGRAEFPPGQVQGAIGIVQGPYLVAWRVPAGTQRVFYTRKVDTNLYSIGSLFPLVTLQRSATVTFKAVLFIGPEKDGLALLTRT